MNRHSTARGQESTSAVYEVAQQLIATGLKHEAAVAALCNRGISTLEAEQFVSQAESQFHAASRQFRLITPASTGSILAPAGGVLAAIIGGLIWGIVAISAQVELGFIAWGLGLIVGSTMLTLSRGQKNLLLGAMASAWSFLGILLGKYIMIIHFANKALVAEQIAGQEQFSFFSMNALNFFFAAFGKMTSGYDMLWIVLAVYTAWRITSGTVQHRSAEGQRLPNFQTS